jgi:hypothetical protein
MRKILLTGYNSKLSIRLDLALKTSKKIDCIDKNKYSNCVHLNGGYCQNTLVKHYCKHINFANPSNLKILKDNNFEKVDKFNQKTNIDSIIDSYSLNIKDLFTKSKYMFPQFDSKHNNPNYIALGFLDKLDEPAPMIIGGNDIKNSTQFLDFNSLFVMENVLTHYSFFVKYSELYLNDPSEVQTDIDLFMFEQDKTIESSNDIAKLILKKDYYDTKFSKLYNYFTTCLMEKPNSSDYHFTLNILEHIIKKFNMIDFEFIKTNLDSREHNRIISQFLNIDKKDIIRKFKTQPQSISNYLKNAKETEVESRVLFEFQYFYALLQLSACNYIPSNNSDPTLEQMINEFYSLNSVFKNLAKEFL